MPVAVVTQALPACSARFAPSTCSARFQPQSTTSNLNSRPKNYLEKPAINQVSRSVIKFNQDSTSEFKFEFRAKSDEGMGGVPPLQQTDLSPQPGPESVL